MYICIYKLFPVRHHHNQESTIVTRRLHKHYDKWLKITSTNFNRKIPRLTRYCPSALDWCSYCCCLIFYSFWCPRRVHFTAPFLQYLRLDFTAYYRKQCCDKNHIECSFVCTMKYSWFYQPMCTSYRLFIYWKTLGNRQKIYLSIHCSTWKHITPLLIFLFSFLF